MTPKSPSLEERAMEFDKHGDLPIMADFARQELQSLRDEMIEDLKTSSGGWEYCLEKYIEEIHRRMK